MNEIDFTILTPRIKMRSNLENDVLGSKDPKFNVAKGSLLRGLAETPAKAGLLPVYIYIYISPKTKCVGRGETMSMSVLI